MEPSDFGEHLRALKPRKRCEKPHVPTWSSRTHADGEKSGKNYWRDEEGTPQRVPQELDERRQEYGIPDPPTSCYSVLNSYRQKHRTSSALPKLPQVHQKQPSYQCPQNSGRSTRNKFCTNNLIPARQNRFKDEVEDEEELKYEEDVISGEENLENDPVELGEEDQSEAYEFNEKEYEEQQADDEVDDESDTFHNQVHRMQLRVQRDDKLRAQQLRASGQEQEVRRLQHQQRMQKMQREAMMSRCYAAALEADRGAFQETSYGDAPGGISEEEEDLPPPPLSPPRHSLRRSPGVYQASKPWAQQTRRLPERYRTVRPNSPQAQQSRKPRSIRPQESLVGPEVPKTSLRKCCFCDGPTRPRPTEMTSSRNGNCRLQDNRGFTVRGAAGEDGEADELSVCGRCSLKLNAEDFRLSSGPSHAPLPFLRSSKPQRPRNCPSPNYEEPEDGTMAEEELPPYFSSVSRSSRENSKNLRDRARHGLQVPRGEARRSSHYKQ